MSFVGFWRPPMTPPPPDTTILNSLTDREGAGITFSRILAPPNAPPPPTPKYLTILMIERGAPLSYAGLCPPPPPPSLDATILNDLNDSERGWAGAPNSAKFRGGCRFDKGGGGLQKILNFYAIKISPF